VSVLALSSWLRLYSQSHSRNVGGAISRYDRARLSSCVAISASTARARLSRPREAPRAWPIYGTILQVGLTGYGEPTLRAWGRSHGMDRTKVASSVKRSSRSARGMASCAAIVILAALCGCGSTTSGIGSAQSSASASASNAVPARVALHINAGSYSLTAPSTTVSGTVTRGASVSVNGRAVPVHSGRWSRTVALRLGRNGVAVTATMRGRAPASKSIRVTRERSATELEAQAAAVALRAKATRREAVAARERKTAEETPACTNGTYVNSAGNTVCSPEQSPAAPTGATAQCEDGTYSFSESRSGTCSHHGGVAKWL
jgi:hypothetical protein